MNGLRQVFGGDALSRRKSCEFHFKESRKRMARKLGQEAGETVKDLLTCNLKETYLEVNEKPERQTSYPVSSLFFSRNQTLHSSWTHDSNNNLHQIADRTFLYDVETRWL